MNIQYPLLIDGGLSNELENLGCDLNHKLWSAKLIESNPEALILTHLAYLNAGAQCIATASYQASFQGYLELGYNKEKAEENILRSVALAEEAVIRFMATSTTTTKPLIAASIGPYGAYLADGSEYHGNYTITNAELKEFHLRRIELLDATKVDFFAFETIPSYREAKILVEILNNSKKSAWMSFSCKDGQHINDGTPISKCAALIAKHPTIFAIGVNCTEPKYISGLIKELKLYAGSKKIAVYPNSGEAYNAENKTWMGTSDPKLFVQMTKEWIELGADIIGGCCRIGPEHIQSIHDYLRNH